MKQIPTSPSELFFATAKFWQKASDQIETGIETVKETVPGAEETAKEWASPFHSVAMVCNLLGMTLENIGRAIIDEPLSRHTPV